MFSMQNYGRNILSLKNMRHDKYLIIKVDYTPHLSTDYQRLSVVKK